MHARTHTALHTHPSHHGVVPTVTPTRCSWCYNTTDGCPAGGGTWGTPTMRESRSGDGWVDRCMCGCADVWEGVWVGGLDGLMGVCGLGVDVWMCKWVGGSVDGWINGRVWIRDGCVDGWTDGRMGARRMAVLGGDVG